MARPFNPDLELFERGVFDSEVDSPIRSKGSASPLQTERIGLPAIRLDQQIAQVAWEVEPSPFSVDLSP